MAEKHNRSLIGAFTKAAAKRLAGAVLLAGVLYGAWFGAFYAGRGEPLTKGEARLVQGVFGNEINTSVMRKHFRPADDFRQVAKKAVATVQPPFSHIDFFGPKAASRDFSKDSEYKFGLFMHESTHCWQGQNLAFPLKKFEIYKYALKPRSRWRDFGAEQKADMVGDYSRRWLYPKNVHIKHTAQDSLLARVVEDRFPQARKTRQQLEQGGPRHG